MTTSYKFISSQNISVLMNVAEHIHKQLLNRFMSPDYLIYDYVGLNGEITLPTPEECRDCKPNALGWWSPIENCAFFTSDYILAQCMRYRYENTQERRSIIRSMISGLYKLQDVCIADGMIARGIGSDGFCHPRASSNDQVIPWLLALREYLKTDIPSEGERVECNTRMLKLILALKNSNWSIPGEGAGFTRGSFLFDEGLEGRLSSVHFVLLQRMLTELGGASDEMYRKSLMEILPAGKSRLQIIGEGNLEYKCGQAWFTGHTHYAVRELLRAETDETFRLAFRNWLKITGTLAAEDICLYRNWNPDENCEFTADWRCILTEWRSQNDCRDAEIVASKEIDVWHKASPAVMRDKHTALRALPAAWMTVVSGERELIVKYMPEIIAAILHFDYSKLHYAALYFVENIVAEILKLNNSAK